MRHAMDPNSFEVHPVHPDDMTDPVEWFFAEHYRHRRFCNALAAAAVSECFDRERLAEFLAFLRHDLALHIIDEEADLFPLLRRRAKPEDELEPVLERLSADHWLDSVNSVQVQEALERCLATGTPPARDAGAKALMVEFAARELRHLAVENAVVLPIARRRLSAKDLTRLARRLATRRER